MANTALILPRVASRLNVFLQTPTQTSILTYTLTAHTHHGNITDACLQGFFNSRPVHKGSFIWELEDNGKVAILHAEHKHDACFPILVATSSFQVTNIWWKLCSL